MTDDVTDDATDIRPLDRATIERIAAGEVVERPASAVKELVENAIDADASRIDVEVESGGIDSIHVRDDGRGMTEADVRAAVREHTTSKIRDVEDLERGVGTLGFRGEALHTIGAVSRLAIRSKPRDGDVGTELVYEGGAVESVDPVGCPEGTTVTVENLFYNVPARRKYLKTTATEFAHVNRVVTQYALANPSVAVSLTHDGRETFGTTGQDDLRATLLSVYGREVAEGMIDLDVDVDPAGPLDAVSGLVSHPETNRASREYLSTFVNGRYVTSRAVREAVVDAYGGQLASDRYPFAVLYLDLPPDEVDVNVHPRKMEIRFEDERAVTRQVREAVEMSLLDHGLIRSTAPRGRSKADETTVSPDRGGDEVVAPDREDGRKSSNDRREPSRPSADRDGRRDSATAATADEPTGSDASPASDSPSNGLQESETPASTQGRGSDEPHGTDPVSNERATGRTERSRGEGPIDRSVPSDRKISGAREQATLTGESVDAERRFESLPSLRVLGQLRETYVVCETDDGLALIDQHAADERVNYERLTEAFEDGTTAQRLAEPVTLELTAGEAAMFEARSAALASLGFHAEAGGDRTIEVTAVPAVFRKTLDPAALRDILAEFLADGGDGDETVDDLADAFIADLACYPSVTGNTSLTEGSVLELLRALDDCENPWACPHGRPVVVEVSASEIEDRFERDYPGHG